MATIDDFLAALEEVRIAREVGLAHIDARNSHTSQNSTADSMDTYLDELGSYYAHHFAYCVAKGGSLPRHEAIQRAREIIERDYRRRGGDIVTAYHDAHEGTSSGLNGHFDVIAEALKSEAVERYTRQVFDTFVAPNSWSDKVELVQQFLDRFGSSLGPTIQLDKPEMYASNYEDLLRAHLSALRQISSAFRRF